jgi:hypothetical protein
MSSLDFFMGFLIALGAAVIVFGSWLVYLANRDYNRAARWKAPEPRKDDPNLMKLPLQYLIDEGFIRVTVTKNKWFVDLPDHISGTVYTNVAGTRTGIQLKVFRMDNPERILTFPDHMITVTDESFDTPENRGEWVEPDRPDLPGDEWKQG